VQPIVLGPNTPEMFYRGAGRIDRLHGTSKHEDRLVNDQRHAAPDLELHRQANQVLVAAVAAWWTGRLTCSFDAYSHGVGFWR
jgi:hypothetical protein